MSDKRSGDRNSFEKDEHVSAQHKAEEVLLSVLRLVPVHKP